MPDSQVLKVIHSFWSQRVMAVNDKEVISKNECIHAISQHSADKIHIVHQSYLLYSACGVLQGNVRAKSPLVGDLKINHIYYSEDAFQHTFEAFYILPFHSRISGRIDFSDIE